MNRILDDVTRFIFVEDAPQQADVILLPGASDPTIPERAAELFHAGFAPLLLPSGGVSLKTGRFAGVRRKAELYDGDYVTECSFYVDVLHKCGVPRTAMLLEDRSGSTRENAIFSRHLIDKAGLAIHSAIVVCKSFHARRCLMYYQLAFPETVLAVAPVDVFDITRENWHTTPYGVERVMGELARCGNQFVEDFRDLCQ